MTVTERSINAIHGPQGSNTGNLAGAPGTGFLQQYALNAAQSVSVNGTSEQIIYVVPGISPYTPFGGTGPTDSLATVSIATLTAVRLAASGVALAANLASSTFGFFLRRGGAVIGGGAFAGWAAASNAAIAAYSQVIVPWLPANTALVAPPGAGPVSATVALLPVQPGDLITFSVATSAAATIPFLAPFVDPV